MRSRPDKKIFNARICFWNINGRTHFLTTDFVIEWIQTNFDIIFVTETHFIKGTRFSVPCFTSYHNPLSDHTDRKPQGGISCFIRTSILDCITEVNKNISETIVIQFVGGHRVFGNYIVPMSSPYFVDGMFSCVANQFCPKNVKWVVIGGGDLNARVGDIKQKLPSYCSYRQNEDECVNESGITLRSICASYNCFVINNMSIGAVVCDGDFTFEKGGRRSQNDLILVNEHGLCCIQRFRIHQIGWNPSDHTPVSIDLDLDVTDVHLAVAASHDILYDQSSDLVKKPRKIQQNVIDWERYKSLAESDYQHYENVIQQLGAQAKLQDIDACVNKLTDSLYNCATILTPQHIAENDAHSESTADPLIEMANQVHSKWRRGECDSSIRDTVHEEVIEHLKTSAILKERKAWANVLQEGDSKAVWDKINWKGTFDKDSVSSKPTLPALASHFMKKGQSVEDSTLLSDVIGDTHVPELDGEISMDEISKATNRLKEKSSGDGWSKGMVTNLPACILYALQILYNAILSNHCYPTRWRTTLVNEIFKNKGNSAEEKNYRGISLVALLSKVYDIILCNRFTKWFKPDDGQTAYQNGKSSADHVFLTRCMVQQCKRLKEKLFIVAFDFDGAFDRVSRSLLIRKLIRFGAGVTFVACVASMYMCTDNIIFRNREYVMFKLFSGIKQGLPLSPMLFIFYINDMFEVFRTAHGRCIDNVFKIIHLLIHADDLTLFAIDRDSVISKLETLRKYCDLNYIIPQVLKCKFLTINGNADDNIELPFGDSWLEKVNELELLGSHICDSGSLVDELELHMKKRYFSCIKFYNFCRENQLAPLSVRLKSLRACVMSSILHNCEAFGHLLPKKFETLYNKLIRSALQVRSNTPSLILYIESGLLPVRAIVEARQYKFFQRFDSSLEPGAERKLVFAKLLEDPTKYLKHYISLNDAYPDHRDIYTRYLDEVKRKIRSYAAKGKPKYQAYLRVNPDLEPSPFLQCMHPLTRDIIRFRVGSHNLPIETGRWCQKKREERLCTECDAVGDDLHYVYNCSLVLRDDLKLENDIGRIWTHPDIFTLIRRLKAIDLL